MAGKDGFGAKFAISADGGTTYTDVASLTNIDILDVKVDTIETTAHDSASQWRTFIGSLKDGGELGFDINYDPALHGAVFSAIGGVKKMKVTLNDGTGPTTGSKVSFDGIITGFKAQAPFDDKLSASLSVKVSGIPVIVIAT